MRDLLPGMKEAEPGTGWDRGRIRSSLCRGGMGILQVINQITHRSNEGPEVKSPLLGLGHP